MDEAEFDQFAEEYRQQLDSSVAISGESADFFAQYKVERIAKECAEQNFSVDSVLDFGAGVGSSVPYFRRAFPNSRLTCLDVSKRSLEVAEHRFSGQADMVQIAGERIPLQDNSVSLAFSACVFHHIPEDEHVAWMSELRRVVRPGGKLFVFEHNPLNPLTVKTVRSCPFDDNAVLIRAGEFQRRFHQAGWRGLSHRYTLFFPGFLSFLRPLENSLGALPLGAQYFVSGEKPDH